MLLRGRRVAVRSDSWRYAYEAAHEIAELVHGFRHTETMFMHQGNILAAWHRLRSGLPAPEWLRVGPIDEDEVVARLKKRAKKLAAMRRRRSRSS